MARFPGSHHGRTIGATWLAALLLAAAGAESAQAQTPKSGGLPPLREVSFTTRDGVEIAAVYYPTAGGKESIPVILLHEVGGSGADFKGLATYLQGQGFAVLVPDLRGHGGSTKVRGTSRDLDHKKMPNKMYQLMCTQGGDIDVCKEFLIRENNQEKLNIDKLCIVGAGLGGTLAMNWAVVDWAWPVVGGVKQGQDIKAIAMLSPPYGEKGVTVTAALRTHVILKELAVYIAVGSGKPADDARKIHKPIDTARGGTEGEDVKKKFEKKLLLDPFETNRQGTQMLTTPELKMGDRIKVWFTETVGKRDLPWKERKSPFE
jgi:pimeloyl-ACP methyl ester carboxylesterase